MLAQRVLLPRKVLHLPFQWQDPTSRSSEFGSGAVLPIYAQREIAFLRLRIMTERLHSIEATLARAQVVFPNAPASGSLPRHRGTASHSVGSGHSPSMNSSQLNELHQHKPGTHNPVEAAGEAMAVEGLVDLGAPRDIWDAMRPDVLSRSMMTIEECEAEFKM